MNNVDQEMKGKLKAYYMTETESNQPSTDWWRRAISNAAVQKQQTHWFRLPRTRLAWALIPVIILLIGGAVYAGTTVIRQLFVQYAPHIENAGLAQELNLSQTIDGITVRLERAYADSNTILLGYTISGPEDRYNAIPGKLSTDDGETIPGMIGIDIVPESESVMGDWRPGERDAVIKSFNASSLFVSTPEVNLHLEIYVDKAFYRSDVTTASENTDSVVTFKFDFTTAFHAGKEVIIDQTVQASGLAINLQKVVISPSGTRLVCQIPDLTNFTNESIESSTEDNDIKIYFPSDTTKPSGNITIYFDSQIFASITLPSGMSCDISFSQNSSQGNSLSSSFIKGDFLGEKGEWTFSIDRIIFPKTLHVIAVGDGDNNRTVTAAETQTLPGPWVFRFQVP